MNTKYPKPVPEKHQRRARLRRLYQQLRDMEIGQSTYDKSVKRVEKDYKRK